MAIYRLEGREHFISLPVTYEVGVFLVFACVWRSCADGIQSRGRQLQEQRPL